MSEFVDVQSAFGAQEAGPSEAERAERAGMGDIWSSIANVGTQLLNAKVPGLGPALNPGFYKEQAATAQKTAAAQQSAAQAQLAVAKAQGLPSWVIPASIAGGVAVLAIVLAVSMGGRRRNPIRRRRRRRRFYSSNGGYGTAAEIAAGLGRRGYYVDESGDVGVRSGGAIQWFSYSPETDRYEQAGSSAGTKGATFRAV